MEMSGGVGPSKRSAPRSDLELLEQFVRSPQGKLFYHHIASNTSQWPGACHPSLYIVDLRQMPPELGPVLGESQPESHLHVVWLEMHGVPLTQVGAGRGGWQEVGRDVGAWCGRYWRNEKLGVSSWKDPRRTTNLFQVGSEAIETGFWSCEAALDGNLFFLQLYTEVGGFLDAAAGLRRSVASSFELRWTAKAARLCTTTAREAPPKRCTICCSMVPVWTSWTAQALDKASELFGCEAPRRCIGRRAMATLPS